MSSCIPELIEQSLFFLLRLISKNDEARTEHLRIHESQGRQIARVVEETHTALPKNRIYPDPEFIYTSRGHKLRFCE